LRGFRIPFKLQLLIPMVLILAAIVIFPLGYSFVISLQDFQLSKIGQEQFVGLEN
jgi:ABC-type sugar transport system permease subunit